MLQLQLIQLYYYICHCYDKHVCLHFQRQSNNFRPEFTDQEVLTMYLFGIFQKRFTVKDGYHYMKNHWLEWFPAMPSYQAYNYRLNQLYWQFEVIISESMAQMPYQDCYPDISLTDSLPIMLSKRPYQAKVALQVADKGYCSSKDLYYHGMKFHFLGFDTYKRMPTPEYMYFTAASASDLTSLKTILPTLSRRKVIGDKIFACAPLNTDLSAQGVEIMTPVKLKKGQKYLEAADKLFSCYISSVRQPVESFFNWLIEKTAIQTACKVRSEKGLWVHCFGRLAAALFILVFNS
jgi:hypothetical protein